MASGIGVSDEAIALFEEFKLKKTSFGYLVFKIDGDEVVLDYGEDKSMPYVDFAAEVAAKHPDDPRYLVIDYEYKTSDGRDADKIIFITWQPEYCSPRKKMPYSSTKLSLTSALVGIAKNLNATEISELDEAILLAECNKI